MKSASSGLMMRHHALNSPRRAWIARVANSAHSSIARSTDKHDCFSFVVQYTKCRAFRRVGGFLVRTRYNWRGILSLSARAAR